MDMQEILHPPRSSSPERPVRGKSSPRAPSTSDSPAGKQSRAFNKHELGWQRRGKSTRNSFESSPPTTPDRQRFARRVGYSPSPERSGDISNVIFEHRKKHIDFQVKQGRPRRKKAVSTTSSSGEGRDIISPKADPPAKRNYTVQNLVAWD